MQLNPLQVVLSDMHHAGVSDAVTDNPFDFFTQKIENPFADDMASAQPAMAAPVAAATQTVERAEQSKPQQPAATPKVQTQTGCDGGGGNFQLRSKRCASAFGSG